MANVSRVCISGHISANVWVHLKVPEEREIGRKQVAISEFKAKCLAMLEEVRKTKEPLCVAKFASHSLRLFRLLQVNKEGTWIGSTAGEIKFSGDVLSPVFEESDWKESDE